MDMGFEVIKKMREARGWSLRELASKTDSYPQQLNKIELGRQQLTDRWIHKLAKAFAVQPSIFLQDHKDSINFELQPKIEERIAEVQFGPDMVPILGHANGSSDAVMLNINEPIGEAPRHPNQKGVKNAFYLRVYDESMVPRYYPDELAAVVGGMSPAPKKDCIIELMTGEVYIKQFIRMTDKELVCRQLNPAKDWKRPRSEIKAIHAVVGRG